MAESTLSPVGQAMAQLPSSQASVERLFSRCGMVVDGNRGRLRIDSMAEEVLVRLNAQALPAKHICHVSSVFEHCIQGDEG